MALLKGQLVRLVSEFKLEWFSSCSNTKIVWWMFYDKFVRFHRYANSRKVPPSFALNSSDSFYVFHLTKVSCIKILGLWHKYRKLVLVPKTIMFFISSFPSRKFSTLLLRSIFRRAAFTSLLFFRNAGNLDFLRWQTGLWALFTSVLVSFSEICSVNVTKSLRTNFFALVLLSPSTFLF